MLDCECGAELIQDDDCETILDVCQEAPVVKDYETLSNKPQINGATLDGNKTTADLKIDLDINSAVSAEATLRENADTALGGRIDQEITDRSEAEIALGGRIDGEITNRTNADNALGTRIDNEILARQGGDNNLQTQIDAITSKSDVVDVVATYADLQAYDTQHLGNNDVIKVLDDETHDHSQTYYRWNKPNSTWAYIGSEAPYYSKSQIDTQMAQKQDKLVAGSNIQIASDGKTISATDTTYTAGAGLTLTGTEFSADTTVLATKTEVAPKLQTEVVSELPTTGEESKLYLTPKDYTTGTATGNPITISLGEDAGQITSAQLDGDTYQQSYTGKNLVGIDGITFPFTTNGVTVTREQDGSYTFNGTTTAITNFVLSPYSNQKTFNSLVAYNGQNVTLSLATSGTMQATQSTSAPAARNYGIKTWNGGDVFVAANDGTNFTPSSSGTLNMGSYTDAYLGVRISNGVILQNFNMKIQLELGTATSFEPYCGGVPSPSPDFPQQIQTVTGTQTVSINGTNYPISLGSLELCKLGTYQDYIYKDGDDWIVHKATAKHTLKANEGWLIPNSAVYPNLFQTNAIGDLSKLADEYTTASTSPQAYCEALTYLPGSGDIRTNQGFSLFHTVEGGILYNLARINITGFTTTAQLNNWLSTCNASFWYGVKTPTDTTITDTNLIAQLEAVRNATLQASNTITNTATGTNLAGDLELGYYEYDPQNRYDKWLWLDLNNNYEKLGS